MRTLNRVTMITIILALSFFAMPAATLLAQEGATPTAQAPQEPAVVPQVPVQPPAAPSSQPAAAVGQPLPQAVEQGGRAIERPTLILDGGKEVPVYSSTNLPPIPSHTGGDLYHDENTSQEYVFVYEAVSIDGVESIGDIIGVMPVEEFERWMDALDRMRSNTVAAEQQGEPETEEPAPEAVAEVARDVGSGKSTLSEEDRQQILNRIDEINKRQADLDQELTDLGREIDELTEGYKNLKEQLEKSQNQKEGIELSLEKMLKQEEELIREIQQREESGDAADLQRELEDIRNEISVNKEKLEILTEDINGLEEARAKAEEELIKLKEKFDALYNESNELGQEYLRLFNMLH